MRGHDVLSRRQLLMLGTVLAVGGCAQLAAEPLQVRLSSVDPLQATPFEQRFLLTLRLGNPNDAAVELTGLTLDLELNGEEFLEGLSNQSVVVPRLGYADLQVEAATTLLGLFRQFWALQGRDTLTYRMSGRAYVKGAPLGWLSYRHEGTLRFAAPPSGGTDTLPALRAM